MFDVCAMGELLVDFTPAGNSADGRRLFKSNPGGAPANVLAALIKLGGNGVFIGKIGKDQFGYFLKQELIRNKIDASGLILSGEAKTTLAFIHLDEKGDRSFSFYRDHEVDILLAPEEINLDLIDKSKIFHFGSLSLTDEPCRSATIRALDYAKKKGKLISYDPNWRPALWKSEEAARENMLLGLSYADIVKVSKNELEFLTQQPDLAVGTTVLLKKGIQIVVVTLGPKGCFFKYKGGSALINTYNIKVVDTTGAGDAFTGGMLYCLSNYGKKPEEISLENFTNIMKFANAVGSLSTSGYGAMPSMPSMEQVEACMKNVSILA